MQTIQQALAEHAEQTPAWLQRQGPASRPVFKSLLKSRTVFYPGANDDGHPLLVFGAASVSHCFVFADVIYDDSFDPMTMKTPAPMLNFYELINHKKTRMDRLRPRGWIEPPLQPGYQPNLPPNNDDHGLVHWVVLGLKQNSRENQLPPRLCLLFVNCEACAAYHFLFCQCDGLPPYAVVLQDHGQQQFGGDSPMSQFAAEYGRPKWLLVTDLSFTPQHHIGHHSDPWPEYERVSNPLNGGSYNLPRSLYRFQATFERYRADPATFIGMALQNARRDGRNLFSSHPTIQQHIVEHWDTTRELYPIWAEHLQSNYRLWKQCPFLHTQFSSTPQTSDALYQAWIQRIARHPNARLSCPAFILERL